MVTLIPDVEMQGNVKLNFSSVIERLAKNWSIVDLTTLRNRVGEFLVESSVRVVIFIDDIDRLDHTEVQSIFRLVKLTADFKNATYVLAFDEELAAQALAPRYGHQADKRIGSDFLEKIVQVPLRIPNISQSRLQSYYFREIERVLKVLSISLTASEGSRVGTYFSQACGSRLTTPRAAKRFANALAVTLPLVQDEANVADFILIESLHFFYPDVYKFIRSHPEIFLNDHKWQSEEANSAQQAFRSALSSLTESERNGVENLLHELFPRFQSLSRSITYTSDWDSEWAQNHRISSARFFDRYFSYGVGNEEVSEQEIRELVAIALAVDSESLKTAIDNLLTTRDQGDAMYAIRRISAEVTDDSAALLAEVIAMSGPKFSDQGKYGIFTSPRFSARMLIPSLLEKIVDFNQRSVSAQRVLKQATPLIFAVEILSWLREYDRKKGTDENVYLGSEVIKDLNDIILTQIYALGVLGILDMSDSDDGRFFLGEWQRHGNAEKLREYLAKLVDLDYRNASKLVKCLTPVATSLHNGVRFKNEFTSGEYEILSEMIDPEHIYRALQQQFDGIINADYDQDEPDVNLRLARQFSYVHRRHQDEKEQGKETLQDDIEE